MVEYLALAVSLEDLAAKTNNVKTQVLTECLDQATAESLDADKNPGRGGGQLNNRGSHFYLAWYWAQALAAQSKSEALVGQFSHVAAARLASETIIVNKLIKSQGKIVDIAATTAPTPRT